MHELFGFEDRWAAALLLSEERHTRPTARQQVLDIVQQAFPLLLGAGRRCQRPLQISEMGVVIGVAHRSVASPWRIRPAVSASCERMSHKTCVDERLRSRATLYAQASPLFTKK